MPKKVFAVVLDIDIDCIHVSLIQQAAAPTRIKERELFLPDRTHRSLNTSIESEEIHFYAGDVA